MPVIRETSTERRTRRVRHKLKQAAPGKLRLSVYRSNLNLAVQIIDDTKGVTLVSATTLEKKLRTSLKNGRSMEAAATIGKTLAERATKAGITEVYFDRGSYRFTGRLKALADAARAAGLKF
jgi:large subunit ribosomal protein L18